MLHVFFAPCQFFFCLFLLFAPIAAHAQTPPGTAFDGMEGNWIVRWTGIQENRITEAKISLFRPREWVCREDEFGHCLYHQTFKADSGWQLDGRAADNLDYGYVQELNVDPGGSTARIRHAPAVMGHWGGWEDIRRTGPDSMTGNWTYGEWAGQGTWQRVRPNFTGIEISGRDIDRATPLGSNRVAVNMTWNKFSWPAWITAGCNRPRFYVKVRGTDLWGHHYAAFEDAKDLFVSRVSRHRDELGEYLGFEVSIWPGARTGQHVLWVGKQQFVVDLTIKGQPVNADLYVKPGTSTEVTPMQPEPGRTTGAANRVTFQARSTGERLATRFDLTLKTDVPLELFALGPCRTVDKQSVRCRIDAPSGQVAQQIAFWANPLTPAGGTATVPVTISGVVQAADSEDWVAVQPYTAMAHLRDCNGAYAAALGQVNGKLLSDALTAMASPVPALPGKRLYEGPTKPISLNEAQTYRVKLMTDQMAQAKSPDGYLTNARAGNGPLGRITSALTSVPEAAQCSNLDTHRALLQDLRTDQITFRTRAQEIENLAADVARVNTAVDRIVANRLKAFSGQLPKPIQAFFGFGGTSSLPDFSKEDLLIEIVNNRLTAASEVAVSGLPETLLLLMPKAIGEFMVATPGMTATYPNTSFFFQEAPGMLALAIGGIQIGVSLVDLALLTDTWTDKEELTSWVEANAYFKALDWKYQVLDDVTGDVLDAFEAAVSSNPCTCGG